MIQNCISVQQNGIDKDNLRRGSALTGCLLLILLSGALGTQSGEFQIVADDFKDRGAVEIIFQFVERCDGRIHGQYELHYNNDCG